MKSDKDCDKGSEGNRSEKPVPLVVSLPLSDFEREVLDRLARLQTKIEMLTGNGQPGRMALAEQRLRELECSDIKRSVQDRILNAVIAVIISAAIALHDHLGFK